MFKIALLASLLTIVTLSPNQNSTLNLKGAGWDVQRASEVVGDGETISKRGYDSSAWLNAVVPGTVLTSFVEAKEFPEPTYDENIYQIPENFFNSEFWYRNEFAIPSGFVRDRVYLNFDGINWKADVWFNGKQIGRIEGAFKRARYDVTDLVRKNNVVAVKIYPNDNPGEVHPVSLERHVGNGGILGLDNPTFHCTVGWDWIPTVPGRDIGIWDDVYLTSCGQLSISDPFVESTLNSPENTKAKVKVGATVSNSGRRDKMATLEGKIGDYGFTVREMIPAGQSRDMYFVVDMADPQLWWPNGYGEPYLYDVNLKVYAGREQSDRRSFKAGIRQMSWNEDDGRLTLYINGRRFSGKGGNWGFPEILYRYGAREYDIAVRYHAEQNFTMIRDWVGQTGQEEFYDACDKYGIVVWQDFWLANPYDGPDPGDEAMFLDNARDYIRRIRSHASIGLYCGRNEGVPPATIDAALREMLSELHPGIPYISDSADGIVSGRGPYFFKYPSEVFGLWGQDKEHSERGMPNVMNYESLATMLAPEHIWPMNDAWGLHDYVMNSAQQCRTINETVDKAFGMPDNAERFCQLAQFINYDGYRAMFEGRSRERRSLLLWMSHSCWPSQVWSTYDYYFDPTASYFGCKKGCEPLHIQYNPLTHKVEVVNLSAGDHPSLRAAAQWFDMNGKELSCVVGDVISHEDTTVELFDISFPEGAGEVCYLKLELAEGDKTVSSNFYIQSAQEYEWKALADLGQASVETSGGIADLGDSWRLNYQIDNIGSVPALMLHAVVRDADGKRVLPAFWDDNYIHLLPSESRILFVEVSKADCKGRPQITLEGFNL